MAYSSSSNEKCKEWINNNMLDSIDKLNDIVNNTSNKPQTKNWSKFSKTVKHNKLMNFANNYKTIHSIDSTKYDSLVYFFKICLNNKILQKNEELNYNTDTEEIDEIFGLEFSEDLQNFHINQSKLIKPKSRSKTTKTISKGITK